MHQTEKVEAGFGNVPREAVPSGFEVLDVLRGHLNLEISEIRNWSYAQFQSYFRSGPQTWATNLYIAQEIRYARRC